MKIAQIYIVMEYDLIWKPIPGYENIYEISSYGDVASLNYHGTGRRENLRQEITRDGYKRVRLSKGGKTKRYAVHRLVAMVFLPNPNGYDIINHIDVNPLNNRAENLEWCTQSHNIRHDNSIQKAIKKRNLSNCKNAEKKVLQISIDGGATHEYRSLHEASSMTGASPSNICAALKGRRRTCNGYIWKYKEEG